MAKKQVEVIEMNGAKTVAKKTSIITTTKRVFAVFTVIWLIFVACFPLYVKNHYSGPIKKSLVVSMFFDLQRNIAKQYENLLSGIKKSINMEKPVGIAIEKVKIVESKVDKVTDATAKAKKQTNKIKQETGKVSALAGVAGKFGVKTGALDKALSKTNDAVATADKNIAKVDAVADQVNKKLDSVKTDLVKISQTEVDKMIDDAVKHQLDKNSGGLGTTLLTNYGIKHVYAWRPSSWPVAVKIYNDLEKSNVGVVQILTRTVNTYFGYVAWGLVIAAWALGFVIWLLVMKRVNLFLKPFVVCPRCGHTFSDKRTALGLLKALQPWKWF